MPGWQNVDRGGFGDDTLSGGTGNDQLSGEGETTSSTVMQGRTL
ncbi:hypothetical protein [Roseivivax marinus]|nr:hypothetical protein [Roseivivax marinus]